MLSFFKDLCYASAPKYASTGVCLPGTAERMDSLIIFLWGIFPYIGHLKKKQGKSRVLPAGIPGTT